MNVLIIDTDHVGLDFAMRAAACDHEVRLFRHSKKPTRYAEGFGKFFELIDDWRPSMAWAKDGLILITANNRYITELDRFREFGFKNIFGPTVASSRLEITRSAGMEAMQAVGVDVPPYQTFDSLEAAETFARKSDRAWVFKPMGDEEDKSLTYVSKDPADLVGWLQRQKKLGKKLAGKAMLQEKVERLAEIGVSGWMGPEGFLPDRWQVCFEHKPLFPGDIGPATGEQATCCQYSEKDKLAEQMLMPLEPVLRTLGHRGDFAVGAIVDTKGKAHFLEVTARCGWPAWWIQAASHRGDPVRWMKDLLDGKDSLKVSYDVAIGVVMAQPDYPYDNATPEMVEGVPIRGAEGVLPDLHLVEAMLGKGPVMEGGKVVERPTYETAGTYVCVATGLGKTVEKARAAVYGVVDQVHFPNRMFRNDAGEKVIAALPALHRHGYALDMMP
jgi:phosphoribosylamine---glycine ligase